MTSQALGRPLAAKLLCYRKDGSPYWAFVLSCPMQSDASMSLARANLVIMLEVTTSKVIKVGKYLMGKVLGKGASGLVRKCRNTQTGAPPERHLPCWHCIPGLCLMARSYQPDACEYHDTLRMHALLCSARRIALTLPCVSTPCRRGAGHEGG